MGFNSSDVSHSSPMFCVAELGESFQLNIKPLRRDWNRRGASFKNAEGKCAVMLECASLQPQLEKLEVQISLSVGHGDRAQESGQVVHDFVKDGIFSFKTDHNKPWALNGCQDPRTNCVMFKLG